MASTAFHRVKRGFLGLLAMAIIGGVAYAIPTLIPVENTSAWIVRQKPKDVWLVLDEQDVMSGATVPADVNVVFHVPLNVTRISREILLGHRGETTRYWGYCYPENNDPATVDKRTGLKGLLFLSERERAIRAEQAKADAPQFSLTNLPTKEDVRKASQRQSTVIRHQIDVFKGGQLCYLMSEAPLAIGIDIDGDRLNNRLETDAGTDPLVADSDQDGILDGIEVMYHTNPLLRDTDQDGIIDGIEDANWNGIIDTGETDPRAKDSDRDGLCDGQCSLRLANGQTIYTGEDTNLNGVLDEGETSPILADTDGDGIFDEQEFLVCFTTGSCD